MDIAGFALLITTFFSAMSGAVVLIIREVRSTSTKQITATNDAASDATQAANGARHAAEEASGKLDVIHDLANSNLSAVKDSLIAALDHISELQGGKPKSAPAKSAPAAKSAAPARRPRR